MFKKDLGLLLLILVVGAAVALINPRFLSPINLSNTANLVGLFGLFSLNPIVRSHFFTGINCKIILLQTVIVAIGALGMTLIIISGGIDLSVGSVKNSPLPMPM